MSPKAAMPAWQLAKGHCMQGTDADTCPLGKDQGRLSQENVKDDKAPPFQEVVLRAKSPKGCFLLRGTCGPAVCDLTRLTLDFNSSLLCTWAALTVNREKQASPH